VEVVVASAAEVATVDRNHTPAAAEDSAHHAGEATGRAPLLHAVGGSHHAVDWCRTAEARAVKEQPWAKHQPSRDAGTYPVMLYKILGTQEPFLVKPYSVASLEALSQSAKATAFAAAFQMPPETALETACS
jgi:hypothetical protein